MRCVLLIYLTFFLTFSVFAKSSEGNFSGRISRINVDAGLVRVKVDFSNIKYVNKKDKADFWNEHRSHLKCEAYVAGRTATYILFKVSEIKDCMSRVTLSQGVYLHFFSQDLKNNIKMGHEVVSILLKKRLALKSKMSRSQKDLDSHIEKVEAVNQRFQLLREKLEAQWQNEIQALEEDKISALRNYKGLEIRLDEVNHKIEKYYVEDENLVLDRWSLDPRLYYKK